MDEKLDKGRDKKCALRRRVIHKALSHPADSALRPHTPLSREIAFARSVILPYNDPKTERRNNERCKVIKELVGELSNPSFEDMIDVVASTINPDENTRDLDARNEYKRNVSIQKQNTYI